MQVKNRSCIWKLSWKSMQAARTRNIIAILAIALTTMLFTALLTIAFSLNDAIQDNNFRQVGGWSHGGFKYLTAEQYETLKSDPLIQEYGLRRFVGKPEESPFHKSHVEISYSDANEARWMYCVPQVGRLPQEGTNEAATDTHVLYLLGIEPQLGAEFTLSFSVNGVPTTQTFTLCGWWEHDEAIVANHVLIPQSRAEQILQQLGVTPSGLYGTWNLDVMLEDAQHIKRDLQTILTRHGYQSVDYSQPGYIEIGVNWGYSGAQLSEADPTVFAALAAFLLLIVFTGYLIIYNVFQISVSNDIRFYGLLKTIGVTGRQMRRIVVQQALCLAAAGIPLGLLLGYGAGYVLTPVLLQTLNGVTVELRSADVRIFVGAALFALLTVLLSCRRPGRIAARVSPVEAVCYTEGGVPHRARRQSKHQRQSRQGASLPRMAWANLGRSRGKTMITVASLSLAVVLLNLTVTFVNGFDLDKYLSKQIVSDFVVADASYFQAGGFFEADKALPEEIIAQLQAQGGIEKGGRIYGKTSAVQEFVTEAYCRQHYSRLTDANNLNQLIASRERTESGLLAESAQLYGMERYALEKLTLLDGDISKLYEPGGRYIAAVYSEDDYGRPQMDSHWASVGDVLTLRYVEEWECYDPQTGAVLSDAQIAAGAAYWQRAKQYRDVQYQVAALVSVPHGLSYRYYGTDEFVLNGQTFVQDTGTNSIMQYSFDTTQTGAQPMEAFLRDLTGGRQSQYDYESRITYQQQFDTFRSMILIFGGALSLIVGLVGVLNFLNAILTGILVRRREFAVLQSIGMTGAQLKQMLIWEGVYYALAAVLAALLLSLAIAPVCAAAMSSMFWFFTYRFTIWPVFCVAPVFLALGAALPLLVYRAVARHSLVERLRQLE